MHIEVVIQNKGSITIVQKVDLTPKELRKLTAHAVGLINDANKREQFGFESGTNAQLENASQWRVPPVSDVDAKVK